MYRYHEPFTLGLTEAPVSINLETRSAVSSSIKCLSTGRSKMWITWKMLPHMMQTTVLYVYSSPKVDTIQAALQQVKSQNVRIEYTSHAQFEYLAKSLHLMTDEKAGVPRTAYKGIVETRPRGDFFLFLTPPKPTIRVVR